MTSFRGCPCCDHWPCLRDMAENEARLEDAEAERLADMDEADPDLESLAETQEGRGMDRESPDDLEDWPGIELEDESGEV